MNIPLPFTNLISEVQLTQTKFQIERANKIVIITHVSPDGDAMGSSLALYHYLRNIGKDARVIVPNSFPYFLKWMNGADNIVVNTYIPTVSEALIKNADLIFCLDFNTLKRIGALGDQVGESSAKRILIDHHLSPDETFDVTISYPHISSTSEIVFRLLAEMGKYGEITTVIAECVYTGMMTDTGVFTYNSNDPEIFEIISLLIKKGVDRDKIYNLVFNNYSEQRFRLLGFTLSERMKVYPEYKAALIYLSKEDQKQYALSKGDTEGFVNYPLNIKDIIFSVFIREDEQMVKVSLRSQGKFPCNEFAADFFNGGGHLNASGGEYYGEIEDAISIFENGLEKYTDQLEDTFI
ncbi:MAG: bifunctional oligoribonuclease/PAP phosphatase NrnA [Dysgonamonadaceae bacterium]|nr:bifunctional oligoribonuclease/PAP phosphatase NrnA [Dysgonamonadaceae bacterium]MDD4729012.1 bifunctional oligoribonuclease/PAP phosphatase NrnA [Dysgonamonadaceae bacterium]